MLLGLVLQSRGFAVEAAWLGGVALLLSARAGEAVFWASCQFDLLATTLVLGGVLAAARSLKTTSHVTTALWMGGAWLLFVAAPLAKETFITLPAVVAALLLSAPMGGTERLRALGLVAASGIAGLVSVWLRADIQRVDVGPYGRLNDLVSGAALPGNLVAELSAFAIPPGPDRVDPAGPWAAVALVLTILVLAAALRRRAGGAFLSLGAILVTLAPYCWIHFGTTTAGGRYLYLAGVPFAVLVAMAVVGSSDPGRGGWRWAGPAAVVVGILLTVSFLALWQQQRLWRIASALSREAVVQFRVMAGFYPRVHIENLPETLEEGPYVLKSYAFRLYHGVEEPLVRSTPMTIRTRNGRIEEMPSGADAFAEYAPEPGELSYRLRFDSAELSALVE